MKSDIPACRMAGNLYFVGTHKASAHLIDTGDGLVLMDAGYAETADVIVDSVSQLGFDIRDVKYIILSHGHEDHVGGVPQLLNQCMAKTAIGAADVPYLKDLGSDITVKNQTATVIGPSKLKGTDVVATDLRAGAAMVAAGLKAEGTTKITNVEHILRGYEQIIEKLTSVGAKIKLIEI